MRIKKSFLIIFIIVLMVGGFICLKNNHHSSQEQQNIIHPYFGSIQTVITTTATVLPKNRLEIKPPVAGRVEQILVHEGEQVQTGQVLAWMSSTDRAALLDAARGEGPEEYKKWQDVYKPIPLLAPIDGQVIVATTQPGQTVSGSDNVLVLSDRLIVRAQVDETDIWQIKLNQPAVVSLAAYPDRKIDAVVDHIYYESTTVNNVTIYNVDLLVKDVPAFFRSGMNADVDFVLRAKDHILILPVSAVEMNGGQSFVWLKVSDQEKPVKQVIETGITDDMNIEIVSGLKKDDNVLNDFKTSSLNKSENTKNPFSLL